jgi:hypothetical protein
MPSTSDVPTRPQSAHPILIAAKRAEWALKRARNDVIDRWFSMQAAGNGRLFATTLRRENIRLPCFAVAFNTPWAIELLCASWRLHGTGFELLVMDNSTRGSARKAHASICDKYSVRYFALPYNPEWSPNRSHGIAMNWIWRNVCRWLEPDVVGWIDHDCFPTCPVDLPRLIGNRVAYGSYRVSPTTAGAFYLWAGYCFFRYSAAASRPIDFKPRIDIGLDTGGGNWPGLLRHLRDDQIGHALREQITIEGDDLVFKRTTFDHCFLHVGGASYRSKRHSTSVEAAMRRSIWRTVAPALTPCTWMDELRPSAG